MAYLLVTQEQKEICRQSLNVSPIVIGRGLDCDIFLGDPTLSRHHCQLVREEGGWFIVDLASRNGTWQGMKRLTRLRLHDQDEIRIAGFRLRYCSGRSSRPSSTPATPHNPNDTTWLMPDGSPVTDAPRRTQAGARVRVGVETAGLGAATITGELPLPRPRPHPPVQFATPLPIEEKAPAGPGGHRLAVVLVMLTVAAGLGAFLLLLVTQGS